MRQVLAQIVVIMLTRTAADDHYDSELFCETLAASSLSIFDCVTMCANTCGLGPQ